MAHGKLFLVCHLVCAYRELHSKVNFANGNISLTATAIMEIFYKLSLFFFLFAVTIRLLVQWIFKKKIDVAIETNMRIVFLLLTGVYCVGLLSIPWMPNATIQAISV